MSDWTTDIDHPKYKETKRKFQAEEPLTAIEALVAFNEFRGGLGDDGYSEMEIERHLQEHVTRVAELEAELKGSRAEVERLRDEVMPMRDAFGRCRAMLGLGDCDDMPSVVRRLSMMKSELHESKSANTRLEAQLRISVDTNSKLISRLNERKEGGA